MKLNNEEVFKPRSIVVKAVSGKETLTYETWLVQGGLKFLVGNSEDKELEQARAKDIFTFFKGSVPGIMLHDFVGVTKTEMLSIEGIDIDVYGVPPNEDDTTYDKRSVGANPISDQLPTSSLPSQGGKF